MVPFEEVQVYTQGFTLDKSSKAIAILPLFFEPKWSLETQTIERHKRLLHVIMNLLPTPLTWEGGEMEVLMFICSHLGGGEMEVLMFICSHLGGGWNGGFDVYLLFVGLTLSPI